MGRTPTGVAKRGELAAAFAKRLEKETGGGRESRQSHCFLGVARAARVRQNEKFLRIDEIENVRERVAFPGKIGASQSDGYDLGSARDERIAHYFIGGKFPGPNEQTRSEFAIRDLQFRGFVRHVPKP